MVKKESQRPWPEVMFYAVFGEHGPESTIKPPKDFDLSLEFLMRNKLSEEDVMFLRERYEKGLSERAIAEQHNLTIGIARGKINKAIKRLRHPSRSKYLRYGLVEATKREVERGRVPAFEEGYQAGYQFNAGTALVMIMSVGPMAPVYQSNLGEDYLRSSGE